MEGRGGGREEGRAERGEGGRRGERERVKGGRAEGGGGEGGDRLQLHMAWANWSSNLLVTRSWQCNQELGFSLLLSSYCHSNRECTSIRVLVR